MPWGVRRPRRRTFFDIRCLSLERSRCRMPAASSRPRSAQTLQNHLQPCAAVRTGVMPRSCAATWCREVWPYEIGVLIWNFSTKFQTHERTASFTEFMQWVESGSVSRVTITGNDISGYNKSNDHFQTYVPTQYDGLVNKLIERGVVVTAKEPTVSP